jgi:hypothetical protein
VIDAVGARHVAALVDQDVERKPGLLDVVPNRIAVLRQDAGDLDSPGGVGRDVGGKLTEPVAAVWSPGAAMEIEQEPPAGEEVGQRPRASFLIAHEKARRDGQR